MKRRLKNNEIAANTGTKLLPAAPLAAVQAMIKISEKLVDIAHKESQALVQQDMLTLSVLQDEKEILAQQYANGSQEFRARLHGFRQVDKTMIRKLETLQTALADQSRANNIIVMQMKESAQRLTERLVKPAQNLGQRIQLATTQ